MKNRGRLGKGVVWVGVNLFEVVKLFIWLELPSGNFVGYVMLEGIML